MPSTRRFPPPWTIDDNGACFIVKDKKPTPSPGVYYAEEPGRLSVATSR
jgi:hypothetical protein